MNRLILGQITAWKEQKTRKPLLLLGARQVGKTHLLKQAGATLFERYHYFDLEEQKKPLETVFNESSLTPDDIIDKLSFISGVPFNKEADLLILDEIQAVPRALTALKYFQEHQTPAFVAAAGSNLGVALGKEPFPVGKVEHLEMFPMTFQEFLSGTGNPAALEFIRNFDGKATDDVYHQRLFELLKIYFVTGGLPEVISKWIEHAGEKLTGFREVRRLQNQLLFHYLSDFSKYSGPVNARHIERIFKSVPGQLSMMQDGKAPKFRFRDVISQGPRSYETLADPIDWLVKAGLVFKTGFTDHPSIPLSAAVAENRFKLFMFDIGLLGAMVGLPPEAIQLYDYGSYKGFFAENFALQELNAQGFRQTATWAGKTAEIEFLLDVNGRVIPVEVKAGVNTKAKSLHAFIEKYRPLYGVKFTGNKFGFSESLRIYNYPLYMISRFPGLCPVP